VQLLQSVAIVNEDIFLINYKEEIPSLIETHALAVLDFQSLVLSELIV
jgi:hypothetical protein